MATEQPLAMTNSKAEAIRSAQSHHHWLPLLPRPTTDPKDPLRWARWLKILALGATAMYNFTANFAGAGLSAATPVLEAQFRKTPNQVNALLTWNFLLLGLGNLFWVPLGVKFGKRPALLVPMLMLFAVLIWTAKAATFTQLLAARCLSGWASSAGESIVPSVVSDIFFLHERAAMMSAYTILISGATAIGPLIASFMVQYAANTWRDYVWVCAGLAGANLVAIFFLYPESNFHRPQVADDLSALGTSNGSDTEKANIVSDESLGRVETIRNHRVDVVKKSWLSIWTTLITADHSTSLVQEFLAPLRMMAKPAVLLTVYIYGTSLASQIVLIFAFPSLLLAPPYLFSPSGVGLIQIAAIIGFVLACLGGGYVADLVTAAVIRRQGGKVVPEQRLVAIIPGCLIAPIGCIVIAFTCSEKLSWIGIAFGFGMVSFGTVYAPNVAITYLVECFPERAAQSLVAVNVFKNLVAFLFLYTATDWIASQGYVQVYMIMFMLVTLGYLACIPFYFFGSRWRRAT